MPRDAFVLKIQRELWHPKCARKGSGLSRNGPLVVYSAVDKLTNDLAPAWCHLLSGGKINARISSNNWEKKRFIHLFQCLSKYFWTSPVIQHSNSMATPCYMSSASTQRSINRRCNPVKFLKQTRNCLFLPLLWSSQPFSQPCFIISF